MRHSRAIPVLCLLLALGDAWPLLAYQTYGIQVNGKLVSVKWPTRAPIRYFVTDRAAGGVTSSQMRDTIGRAFSTWQNVSTASVSSQVVGFTSAEPDAEDGQNTLGFLSRPDLERVLGSTSFLFDDATGEIVEADIFFNSSFPWSVAANGEAGRFDLESIVLHEVGHLFGLGHSGLGETELIAGGGRRVIAASAVMFPIAYSPGNVLDRKLTADDTAGITELYPKSGSSSPLGSISGRVTKNGAGVIGAHVVAFNPSTGALVGNFSNDSRGTFAITGLAPGSYVVRVEPMDDADLESFFDPDASATIDLNYRVTFYQGLVVVPAGGSSQSIEIQVAAK